MIGYSLIKTLHVVGVFLLIGAITVLACSESNRTIFRIIGNVTIFIILITGLALTVYLRVGFPFWLQSKFAIWLLLSVFTLVASAKNLRHPTVTYLVVLLLASMATFLAVLKPG